MGRSLSTLPHSPCRVISPVVCAAHTEHTHSRVGTVGLSTPDRSQMCEHPCPLDSTSMTIRGKQASSKIFELWGLAAGGAGITLSTHHSSCRLWRHHAAPAHARLTTRDRHHHQHARYRSLPISYAHDTRPTTTTPPPAWLYLSFFSCWSLLLAFIHIRINSSTQQKKPTLPGNQWRFFLKDHHRCFIYI